MATVFSTDMVEKFCDKCRSEMEWRSREYGEEYSYCHYKDNEYDCPAIHYEFFYSLECFDSYDY